MVRFIFFIKQEGEEILFVQGRIWQIKKTSDFICPLFRESSTEYRKDFILINCNIIVDILLTLYNIKLIGRVLAYRYLIILNLYTIRFMLAVS